MPLTLLRDPTKNTPLADLIAEYNRRQFEVIDGTPQILTTPTGEISLQDVNVELGTTGEINMNRADVRDLADVPAGAIAMSDLQGKSAGTPINSYAAYLAFLDTFVTTSTDILSRIDSIPAGQWRRSAVRTISGNMYGSPFDPSGNGTTGDSVIMRHAHHLMDSEAEVNTNASNQWEIAIFVGSFATAGNRGGVLRNGYTSLSFAGSFNGAVTSSLDFYWWNGSVCKRRQGNGNSVVIPEY